MGELIKWGLLLGGGYLVYNYFVNSHAAAAATTGTSSTPPASTAPPASSTPPASTPPPASSTPPASTPPPASSTPPASTPPPVVATAQIVGPVSPNVNNSLSANVLINGVTQNLSIIQSSGHAYDTGGHDVTAQLTQQGVNVPALLAAMQASFKGSAGGAGMSGLGFPRRVFGPMAPSSNYVRAGAPMGRSHYVRAGR